MSTGEVLLITLADGSDLSVELADVTLPCVIGRDSASAQIVVPDSQASRAHCTIHRHSSGRLVIEDLGSMNGTWLNDQRITRAPLTERDTLRIGSTFLRIQPPPPPPDPLIDTTLGGFDIQGVLGNGRFGTVYKALQVNLQRPVALKILSVEFRRDPARVKAFLEEARRAGRLNHPNLVQVHDITSVDDQHMLVMELMATSLGAQLKEDGPLDESEVLTVVRDVARALAYAEAQRVVHRDVKPDNILVSADGVAKLADLGIAMHLGDDGKAHQGEVFGSPHYIAPEQARGVAIDGRADLYALGATAWHLLTGKPVYQGNAKQLVAAHVSAPIPDLRKLHPEVSKGVHELLLMLLAKDPDNRCENAGEVVEICEHLLTQPAAAPPPRQRRITSGRRLRRRR